MVAPARQQLSFDKELRDLYGSAQNAVRQITLTEIQGQIRLGNKSFRVAVDGRQSKPLSSVQRKVQVDFATFALPPAVRDIENRVRKLSPKRTGRFAKSWRWELNGVVVRPESITNFGDDDVLRYVNLQPYVRKAVSNYGARSVKRRRRGRRNRSGVRAPDRVVSTTENLTARVARLVRKKYRGLRITDEWTPHSRWRKPAAARDGRIPTVTIRVATGLSRF